VRFVEVKTEIVPHFCLVLEIYYTRYQAWVNIFMKVVAFTSDCLICTLEVPAGYDNRIRLQSLDFLSNISEVGLDSFLSISEEDTYSTYEMFSNEARSSLEWLVLTVADEVSWEFLVFDRHISWLPVIWRF
jgi:hypothetical protein